MWGYSVNLEGIKVQAQTKRLADVVYEKLCDAIVDGTFAPGERVRDGELADQLSVSRMPVREALQRLERQGLIEMVASRFTRVTDVTPELPAQSAEFLGYQLGLSLRAALPALDEAQRAHAAALARKISAVIGDDPTAAFVATGDLITYVGEQSENTLFESVVSDAWLQLARNLRGAFPVTKPVAELRADFENVATLIEQGDAIGAETGIRNVFLLLPDQPGPAAAVEGLWADLEESRES
ncbi:MAG: GntR family transcriptional regulator [Microbacterium gubbeenense]|uniref:GntR family transcriptional regulator n=1 Tax=Microbacterium gubbeenense TaxID=159896 RepID=UPI003F9E3125